MCTHTVDWRRKENNYVLKMTILQFALCSKLLTEFNPSKQKDKMVSHKWWEEGYDLSKKKIRLCTSWITGWITNYDTTYTHHTPENSTYKNMLWQPARKVLCHPTPQKYMDTCRAVTTLICIQILHSLQSFVYWLFKIL